MSQQNNAKFYICSDNLLLSLPNKEGEKDWTDEQQSNSSGEQEKKEQAAAEDERNYILPAGGTTLILLYATHKSICWAENGASPGRICQSWILFPVQLWW